MKTSKPREFWIDDLTHHICGPWENLPDWPDNERVIHVIEYSAYQEAMKRVEEARQKYKISAFSGTTDDPPYLAGANFSRDLTVEMICGWLESEERSGALNDTGWMHAQWIRTKYEMEFKK